MTTYNDGLTLSQAISCLFESEFSDSEIIELWNEYCDDNSYDGRIVDMDMFNYYFSDRTPIQLLKIVKYNADDIQNNAQYFTFEYFTDDLRTYENAMDAVKNAVNADEVIEWLESSGRWEDLLSDYITADEE